MSLFTARMRYLTAIGAALPSLALSACKDPTPPAVGPAPEASSSISARSTQTAPPPPPPSSDAAPPPIPQKIGRPPSCPSGTFCVSEPASLAAPAAAAPFTKCASTTGHPDDTANPLMARARMISFKAELTQSERAKTADACCYSWVIPCPGGRVFRDATGTPSVARVVSRDDWSKQLDALDTATLSVDDRAALAQHWMNEAAFEHASVASFAQLTLDLLSVAAPPELLAETQRATLDEIEHARITFALAAAYGGSPVGPGALAALPGSCRTLAALAKRTFIDACVGESVASASLADDARSTSDPVLAALLGTMAADEERHAELAWRIVAWALGSGDRDVARALAEAQAEVIDELVALGNDPACSPKRQLRASVLREVVLPCSIALLARAPAGARGATSGAVVAAGQSATS